MRLTDTHCHLDFNQFDDDRADVLQRAAQAGVERILIPAMDFESSLAVRELTYSNSMLYAAVGFHPTEAEKWETDSYSRLASLIASDSTRKIAAIGEIGLDYYWVKEPGQREYQKDVLRLQLQLAEETGKPVILHMREENDAWDGPASKNLLEILEEWHAGLRSQGSTLAARPGVMHSFNGTLETAQAAMRLNFLIGVTGPVTYKNAEQKRQVIRQIPLESLLIETDSPFLAPVPMRGKRNEPAYVAYIADKIAEIHSKSPVEIADQTAANASRLFAWGD